MPPEPPRILQGDFLVTTEDREIELECVSVGGKPAAEVIYFDGLVIDLEIYTIVRRTMRGWDNERKNVWKKLHEASKSLSSGKNAILNGIISEQKLR